MPTVPLPTKIDYKKESASKGIFTIEPFYVGYGTTIGNALRRVLLSSLPGAAIDAVKIKDIKHEFSTIPHVKEDVVDIILNLKQVRLKVSQEIKDESFKKITLKEKGEKVVRAGDFRTPTQIEIINPDLVLATITDKEGEIEMEAWVSQGRGYEPVEMKEKEKYEIDTIAIDSLYSPVKLVGYETEYVRVGQMTNYDRLILTIETDGTITPQEAFEKALEILKDHIEFLLGYGKEEEKVEEKTKVEEETKPEEEIKGELEEEKEKSEKEEMPKKKRGRPRKTE